MRQQRIANRQPDALQGLGLVLLIALAAVAGSAVFSRLSARLGSIASWGFMLYGAAIAGFLLYWFALAFVYTATEDCLRVCRAYGKRERFMADVWLKRVQAYGTPEEMRQRFPDARISRAVRAQCPLEPFALAYAEEGRTRILVIQPDAPMREHLIRAIRRGR